MKSDRIGEFFTSKIFCGALFAAACIISALGLEFYGAVVFLVVICAALLLCDDIMATTVPFLFACVFLCRCYNSYDTFIVLLPAVALVAAVLVWHCVRFRKKIIIGESFYGIVAVAAAVTLGGIGSISAKEYFSPTSLYYVGFLGLGMVVFYLLFRPQITQKKYDVKEKFATAMYMCGMLAVFVVLISLSYGWKDVIAEYGVTDPQKQFAAVRIAISRMNSKANYCTFIMFAMPFAFYRAQKNKLHLLSALSMTFAMCLTGSRAGILLGAVEFAVCTVYAAVCDRKHWWCYALCIAVPFAFLFAFGDIAELIFWRFRHGFISPDDARVKLVQRAFESFKRNPVFGAGLANTENADIYSPVKGAMPWYHMMIPQIVGSLGTAGILAYGYQFVTRARLIFCKYSPWKWAVAISYLGILMMSQLNPGEFSPLPYEAMTVMLFMFMEFDKGQVRVAESPIPQNGAAKKV